VRIKKKMDFYFSLVLLAGLAIFYQQSFLITKLTFDGLGAAFFPRIVILLTAFLTLLLLMKSVDFTGAAVIEAKAVKAPKPPKEEKDVVLKWTFVGLFLVYIIILPWVGYVVATLAFLIGSMFWIGPRTLKSLPMIMIVGVVTTFGVQYLFGNLLRLFLP